MIFVLVWRIIRVSGKNNITDIKLRKLNIVTNQNGVVESNQLRIVGSDNFPPMLGPKITPKPIAPPIKAKLFARFSGNVISATAAWATAIFPPASPANALEIKRRGIFFVIKPNAKMIYDKQVPKIEKARIFFLPYLSDN